MNSTALLEAALLLCLIALAAAFALKALPFAVSDGAAIVSGSLCGLLAVLLAIWARGRWIAGVVLLLALVATLLAGPAAVFMMLFGTATGLGGLFARAGASGAPGMEGVGLQAAGFWRWQLSALLVS